MVMVSLLRGVNLGAHHRIGMEPLRAVYEGLGLRDVRTLLQSGNVLFRSAARDPDRLAARIEKAFEAKFGFRSAVFLRDVSEMREVVAANPFSERTGLEPARLAVIFLAAACDAAARARLAALTGIPEELHAGTRELYVYYTAGMARPVLTGAMLDKALGKIPTTSRNWNTVIKLLALAEEMEG